jgi:alpha-beta hydrolase superfamily lysophospholipase
MVAMTYRRFPGPCRDATVPLLTSRAVDPTPTEGAEAEGAEAQDREAQGRLARRRPRLIVAGITLLLLLLLLGGAAISWRFSSEVLVADHSALPANIRVESLSAGQIVLSRSSLALRPGVYGVDWQAGHAILGAIVKRDTHSVTRELSDVRGYLAPGMNVALDSDVYAGDPGQSLGLRFVNVNVPDELGPMPAWLIPGATHTWAIVVHGINRDPQTGERIVPTLHRAGLSTLLITYRGDQGAPASPDGLHHMGLTEWRDLAAAASYALAHGAQRLLLVGYSMGGAIVTQFMERSALAGHVAGLLLDSPALDWKAILSFNAKELGLPSFVATPLEWMIGARIDANWNSLDALRHPAAFHLPILLFHGTADKTVPISSSDAFARELRGWVTYFRVPGAAHAASWNVNPALYEQRLTTFLARIGA